MTDTKKQCNEKSALITSSTKKDRITQKQQHHNIKSINTKSTDKSKAQIHNMLNTHPLLVDLNTKKNNSSYNPINRDNLNTKVDQIKEEKSTLNQSSKQTNAINNLKLLNNISPNKNNNNNECYFDQVASSTQNENTSYSDNDEDEDDFEADGSETTNLNSNNNNNDCSLNRYLNSSFHRENSRKNTSKDQQDCSRIKKKLNRANRIFYNGFLNKQDKQCMQQLMPEYQAHAAELLNFLKSLWVTNTMCDLSIVIGNRKYPAHRLGLAMFSKKYRDEFQKQIQSNKDSSIYTICLKNTTNYALESILKYIYTAKIDINPANVEEVLSAAKELGIDDLICMANDYLSSLSIGDVLDYMGNMLNKEGSELIVYELYSYIMTHLDKITRTPEYLRSSICVIKALLSDSHLSVCNEIEIFEAAMRWIEFDRQNRLKHLADAMRVVRFTLMTPDELVSKIETQGSLMENMDIFKMVFNAYKYHALNNTQSKLTNFIKREEYRNLCLKGASVPEEFIRAITELSDIAQKLKAARTYTTSKLLD